MCWKKTECSLESAHPKRNAEVLIPEGAAPKKPPNIYKLKKIRIAHSALRVSTT